MKKNEYEYHEGMTGAISLSITPTIQLRPEILLHPNIPKPLHGLNPRTIMGQVWWNRERKKAYEKSHQHCTACGVHKSQAEYHNWLEAHELYEIDYPLGAVVFKELVALCHMCHNFIHSGRMQHLVDQRQMSLQKMQHIIKHGLKILKKAHLKLPSPPQRVQQDWSKWYLVFNGEIYPAKWKSMDEWYDNYHQDLNND